MLWQNFPLHYLLLRICLLGSVYDLQVSNWNWLYWTHLQKWQPSLKCSDWQSENCCWGSRTCFSHLTHCLLSWLVSSSKSSQQVLLLSLFASSSCCHCAQSCCLVSLELVDCSMRRRFPCLFCGITGSLGLKWTFYRLPGVGTHWAGHSGCFWGLLTWRLCAGFPRLLPCQS